ncbi:hypothetical protein PATSB16_07270 [Pandoraea thiooxydans]|nr:hypothetical protein PATSB16_07270 [Pandoraea thiooxydans]
MRQGTAQLKPLLPVFFMLSNACLGCYAHSVSASISSIFRESVQKENPIRGDGRALHHAEACTWHGWA